MSLKIKIEGMTDDLIKHLELKEGSRIEVTETNNDDMVDLTVTDANGCEIRKLFMNDALWLMREIVIS